MTEPSKFDNKCTIEDAKNVVVFHHPCKDGFTSAYFTSLVLDPEETFYVPYNYSDAGDPLQTVSDCLDKNVYFVDCTLRPFSKFNAIAKCANKLVVIDHHKTFLDELEGELLKNPDGPQLVNGKVTARTVGGVFVVFDMSKSGAVLTLECLPKVFGADLPYGVDWDAQRRFAEYIQDRDLWQWKLEDSRAFSAGLDLYQMTFDHWGCAVYDHEKGLIAGTGHTVLAAQKLRVDSICKGAYWIELDEGRVPIVNATTDVSEVGERLLQLYPEAPFSISYRVEAGQASYSLRARTGDNATVNDIAEKYGGGGHPKAAGFRIVNGERPQLF